MNAPVPILEAYPDEIQTLIDQREQDLKNNLPPVLGGLMLESVIDELKLWQVGVLRVSFKGGSPSLHQRIANTADEWSQYGNISFDFGYNPANGTFRQWTHNDTSHIKVGFGYKGYFSLIGVQSVDQSITSQMGNISLNLGGFDRGLPNEWQGIVLHEFGHALGFLHEHQHPMTDCQFDWPELYRRLNQPPNSWNKKKVDRNFRRLHKANVSFGPPDRESIMHYTTYPWMFLNGQQSPCLSTRKSRLSEGDKAMMARAYPSDPLSISTLKNKATSQVNTILSASGLDSYNQVFYEQYRDFLKSYDHTVVQ